MTKYLLAYIFTILAVSICFVISRHPVPLFYYHEMRYLAFVHGIVTRPKQTINLKHSYTGIGIINHSCYISRPHCSLKVGAINDSSFSPAYFRGENRKVATENLTRVRVKDLLIACSHRFDERSDKSGVTTTMTAALARGMMPSCVVRTEVRDGERAHVAHDLTVREV